MFGFLSNPQSRLHRTENDHKSFQPLSAFLKDDLQGIVHCTVTMGTETNLFSFLFSPFSQSEQLLREKTTIASLQTNLSNSYSAWNRDDCHQPRPPCLSLRWLYLSYHIKKGTIIEWAGGDNFCARPWAVESEHGAQSSQWGWQTERTLTPVRLVSHSFGKAS